ncbi:lipid-binding SYLF domain-containing protein [Ameyamaea chiangmaiensis]|nr:lipid-binding SYLF domain-containing protein [Ameyamaea chiangmaiensis]MBS4076456.1 lipid-binding SYLF domain-containing protein [Ameyamaea chiangmaiensis]
MLAGGAVTASRPAQADTAKQQGLVDRATLTINDMFAGATPTSRIQRYLVKARAVMICPSIFRMSIGIGGSGGGCVLLSRDARGSWSDPAFFTVGSGSIGVQLGMQDSEVMFFIMTDHGLQVLLDNQFQMNANASASFATLGSGIESGTTGATNTDIMAIQKSKGLFAGAALGGSKLSVNSGANRNYYGQSVGPEDIVITMRVNNPGADPLRAALMRQSAQGAAPEPGTAAAPPPAMTGAKPALPADSQPYTPPGSNAVQSSSLPPVTGR